jgi:phosphatidylserine decarboxylase
MNSHPLHRSLYSIRERSTWTAAHRVVPESFTGSPFFVTQLVEAMSCIGKVQSFYNRLKRREIGPPLYNRTDGTVSREKLPFNLWLENEIMYSRPLDIIDKTWIIRHWLKNENISSEHSNNKYASSKKIPQFVDFFGIKMDDFEYNNPYMYPTFNEFFIRNVKPEKRPIAAQDDDDVIVSAADSRTTVFNSVSDAQKLFIKGKNFNLRTLLLKNVPEESKDLANDLFSSFNTDPCMVNFRLAPMDYHHFHSPVAGTIEQVYDILGEYFTVEPKALQSDVDVLGENTRSIICIKTENHGRILFIPIGAEAVGTVVRIVETGDVVKKGEKLGHFEYGGSDIIVLFENDVTWDEDMLNQSKREVECLIKMGERIGIFSPSVNST